MNSKRQKFVEIAEKRVEEALKRISLVGNLSNPSSYEYSEKDVSQIFREINKAVAEAKARFVAPGSKKSEGFRLG
jgi:hypothetical protein